MAAADIGDGASGEGTSSTEMLGNLADGGLLRLLVSKPVQEALGRLLFATTDMPVAKFEQIAQGIRDETEARKLIINQVAKVAKSRVSDNDNQELADRALDRWTRSLTRKQKNREAVATRTVAALADEDLPSSAAAPSDDFMDAFEEVAEKASTEELADLLGRILAGEIRRPGAISRHTLHIASILDAQVVNALIKLAPYILRQNWIYIPVSKRGEWAEPLRLLESFSIVNQPGIRTLVGPNEPSGLLEIRDSFILVDVRPIKFGWHVDGCNFTPAGLELLSVIPAQPEVSVDEIAATFYENLDWVRQVRVGDRLNTAGPIDMSTLRLVTPKSPSN
ncbi:DUF2806 domain-containing protein [Lichenicoccus sp.]|uniref:DUF2806 domain-containing protein n=1 Tax=Lichenicoccus sp. TaxID=2781899 RepID=UPI003D0C6849